MVLSCVWSRNRSADWGNPQAVLVLTDQRCADPSIFESASVRRFWLKIRVSPHPQQKRNIGVVAPENYSLTQQYWLGLRLRIGLNLGLGLGLGVDLRLGLGLGLGLRLALALVTLWQFGGGKTFPGATNFPRHQIRCRSASTLNRPRSLVIST